MSCSLNAGFGAPLGAETLALIRSWGFTGVRQDVPTPEVARLLVGEFVDSGLEPIFVVGSGTQQMPQDILSVCLAVDEAMRSLEVGGWIEVGNELDASPVYAAHPERAGKLWQDASSMIFTAGLITGGVTNLSSAGLDWLEWAIRAAPALGPNVVVGYHSYRDKFTTVKSGFSSRIAEMRSLAIVSGWRQTRCTEVGYHTAPGEKNCLGRRKRALTDQEVADFAAQEMAFLGHNLVWYQLNDGPSTDAIDRYGIRRMDGSMKPVVGVFA